MQPTSPGSSKNYLNLQQAAECLAVSIDVLLTWNEYNILKPTITPTGEIGYSEEQINQFLTIQKNTNNLPNFNNLNSLPQNKTPNLLEEKSDKPFINLTPTPTSANNNFAQINNYNFYQQNLESPKENKTTFSFLGIVATFSVFSIIVLVILFSQETALNSLIHQNQLSYKMSDNNSSTVNQSTNLNDPEKSKRKTNSSDLNNEAESTANLNKAFDNSNTKNSTSSSEGHKDQIAALATIIGKTDDKNLRAGIKPDADVVTYGQKASFATSSSCPSCSKDNDTDSTVFDANGNIKVSKTDTAENKLLAATLGVAGVSQNQNLVKQNSSIKLLSIFFIMAILSFYVIYSGRKQLFPIHSKLDILPLQPLSATPQIEMQKLIEVKQKTDGTVVISMLGKEYRVSKPELDSESDKFIERLMQLVDSSIKEIEYDSLSDDKLVFSAPLSKIVTRLGFVGIKRDLFFPRTSKTRVHFRRYITEEDLFSMNLTITDITTGFNNVN